jgi:hypothetical protein
MTEYEEWSEAIQRSKGRGEMLSQIVEWVGDGGTVDKPYLRSVIAEMEREIEQLTEQGKQIKQQLMKEEHDGMAISQH